TNKNVALVCAGETTELDRSIVERIYDPLVHMIRNAIDHGVETPEERRTAGKPERAIVRLSAAQQGSNVVIEASDDGRGLDRELIIATARAKGYRIDGPWTDAEVCNLIFVPGFSTAKEVSPLSGRGVGMDVVRQRVEQMRGRISVSSRTGKGATFRIVVP